MPCRAGEMPGTGAGPCKESKQRMSCSLCWGLFASSFCIAWLEGSGKPALLCRGGLYNGIVLHLQAKVFLAGEVEKSSSSFTEPTCPFFSSPDQEAVAPVLGSCTCRLPCCRLPGDSSSQKGGTHGWLCGEIKYRTHFKW